MEALFVIKLIGSPFILTAINLYLTFKKKKLFIFDFCAYGIGITLFIMLTWSFPEYTEPIILNGANESMHVYLSGEHRPTVYCIFMLGVLGYFLIKFMGKKLSPLLKVFSMALIYLGDILCIVFLLQLSGFLFCEEGNIIFTIYAALVPINYLIGSVALLFEVLYYENWEEKIYKSSFLNSINKFAANCRHKGILAFILALPVLALCIMVLCLFGQQPDSIIKAFTETSDWLLSTKISPPPVEYDGHYLCTVSLRGHKKLVKPLRYGLRGGKRIVVNRQLCVANAFEELIAEKTPRFHRALRGFYDKYGYPISRYIKTALAADIVYLIMKPLEWIFIFTLYLFDKKPENRIARQYLPVDKQREFGREI